MLKNMWYAVLNAKEVKNNKPLKAKRFGKDLVFWRNTKGEIICLDDICPHRGVSLSLGKINNNCIACPFHGFEFNEEGKCTFIPANGKDFPISSKYATKSYELKEEYGFIWFWYGEEQENYPKIEFFDFLDEKFSYSTTYQDTFNTHFTRCVENQLDVSHLAFVHSKTIGKGGRSLVNGPLVEFENNTIKIWVDNKKQGEKRITLDKDLQFLKTNKASLEFRFPNIWSLRISDSFYGFLAFAPQDEENTVLYMRFYQKIVTVPLLKEIFNLVNGIFSKKILNEDKNIILTHFPKNSLLAKEEKLTRSDLPITIFRKIMRNESLEIK
ncbi:MAG: aromatic ring-hydroxylating dioxygenase subunit alpha [Candidatus Sericytochromatia bacterium]